MKYFITAAFATSALFAASVAYSAAEPVSIPKLPVSAPQTSVFDAQTYAVLLNIEARLEELNQRLSATQVSGEHKLSVRCEVVDGQQNCKAF